MRIVHASAGYFEATGIPLLSGRGIVEEDRATAPKVVVLSETAARALFGSSNPVGRAVSPTESFDARNAVDVVGVARDVRFAGPTEPPSAIAYVSLAQFPAPITTVSRPLVLAI